ncbi:MAG: hypothetical protein WKF84_23100 [Pyrinomonadaceae bacterium]
MLISSRVPEGKGVSSSAAIEVASMSAVCAAFGIELAPRDLALLCQKVENFSCRRAVRCDGSDDFSVRRSGLPARAAVPAC